MYSITEAVYTPTALPVGKDHYDYDFPEVIAHKALISDKFPGNSLSAITESLSSTVDGTEVDVRMSKDGVLILNHGRYFRRTQLSLSSRYRTFIFNQTVGDPESSGVAVQVK